MVIPIVLFPFDLDTSRQFQVADTGQGSAGVNVQRIVVTGILANEPAPGDIQFVLFRPMVVVAEGPAMAGADMVFDQ